jgi:hypothetical protein
MRIPKNLLPLWRTLATYFHGHPPLVHGHGTGVGVHPANPTPRPFRAPEPPLRVIRPRVYW